MGWNMVRKLSVTTASAVVFPRAHYFQSLFHLDIIDNRGKGAISHHARFVRRMFDHPLSPPKESMLKILERDFFFMFEK